MFNPKPLRAGIDQYTPYISKEIMDLHYNGHYCGYLKNLNAAIEKYPEFFKLRVSQLLQRLSEIPEDIKEAVRNNAGGAINHEILWETIATEEKEFHSGQFREEIIKTWGSVDKFKEEFITAGEKLFGSGWVWLIMGETKELKIVTTKNQDSPYLTGHYPIFGIDVWEHAYYLQYKNKRGEYLRGIWKILDWKEIEKRFLKINFH